MPKNNLKKIREEFERRFVNASWKNAHGVEIDTPNIMLYDFSWEGGTNYIEGLWSFIEKVYTQAHKRGKAFLGERKREAYQKGYEEGKEAGRGEVVGEVENRFFGVYSRNFNLAEKDSKGDPSIVEKSWEETKDSLTQDEKEITLEDHDLSVANENTE